MTFRIWWAGSSDPARVAPSTYMLAGALSVHTAPSTRPAAPRPMPTFPGHYGEDED